MIYSQIILLCLIILLNNHSVVLVDEFSPLLIQIVYIQRAAVTNVVKSLKGTSTPVAAF